MPYIYPPTEDPDSLPPTIPGQHVVIDRISGDVTVHVPAQSALEAQVKRLESIVWGYEGTLRAIKQRAQKGQAATIPVLATHQLEVIEALAELALIGADVTQTPAERTEVDES